MKVTARSPGKMVLFGEYAVLENATALVTAVNRYCTVTIEPSANDTCQVAAVNLDSPSLQFRLSDGVITPSQPPSGETEETYSLFVSVFESILRTLREKEISPTPIRIAIDTTPFYHPTGGKLGIGASAALTVALTAGLFGLYDIIRPGDRNLHREIFPAALTAHFEAQGNSGSGIDVAACTYGKTLQYQQPEQGPSSAVIHPCSIPAGLFSLPVWSGASASTPEILEKVRDLKRRAPTQYRSIMQELIGITGEANQAFSSDDIPRFLRHVDSFFDLLYKLGRLTEVQIISPAHTGIATLVKQTGGHYKPSGAGHGDLGLAFTHSNVVAEKIRAKIDGSAFDLIDLSLDAPGVTLQIESEKEESAK